MKKAFGEIPRMLFVCIDDVVFFYLLFNFFRYFAVL